jgi:hypothetical protein
LPAQLGLDWLVARSSSKGPKGARVVWVFDTFKGRVERTRYRAPGSLVLAAHGSQRIGDGCDVVGIEVIAPFDGRSRRLAVT